MGVESVPPLPHSALRTAAIEHSARRDYYEVLGLKRDATPAAIKDAFRRLALQYHPDRNKSPGAEERFKEIAEAYAVLSDPKKRADYDSGGFAGVAGFNAEDLFGGIDFEDLFGGSGGFGGGLFERFFGRTARGPARGDDIEILLPVPLDTVAHGGDCPVRVPRPVACPDCSGTGVAPGTAPRVCSACGGSGKRVKSGTQGGVRFQHVTPCAECHGEGRFIDHPCATCGGTGRVERGATVTVRIPIGVEEGTVLRVPGHGMPSLDKRGSPGDLLVVVTSPRDSRFERSGADLWRVEQVDLVDAVLGCERPVPTLGGSATVTIPPGTQPDAVLRLQGRGLPHYGGDRHGDLFLRIRIRLPERLTADERRLFEQLREIESGQARGAHP